MLNLLKLANENGNSNLKTLFFNKFDLNLGKIRLKELLQQKLIECGWRDQVKAYCKGKL